MAYFRQDATISDGPDAPLGGITGLALSLAPGRGLLYLAGRGGVALHDLQAPDTRIDERLFAPEAGLPVLRVLPEWCGRGEVLTVSLSFTTFLYLQCSYKNR